MFSKRTMALVGIVALALMVAQPAQAGVGGCNSRFGVGGCAQLTAVENDAKTPGALELLRGAIPADVLAMLYVMFDVSDAGTVQAPETTDQGVGGCRSGLFGVGGCAL